MALRFQFLLRSFTASSKSPCNAQSSLRAFSTTTPSCKDIGAHLPKHVIPAGAPIPPYPYGNSLIFKQQDKGLYGGQMIQFGNNVSPKTETKTRRHWLPNVLNKSLYSIALGKKIKLRVTSKVLKTIDREGGLDEYLLKDSERRIAELGPIGWNLRWMLMQTPEVIERLRAEAASSGIPQETIDQEWPLTPEWKQRREQRKNELKIKLDKLQDDYERHDAKLERKNESKRIKRVGYKYFKKGWVASHKEGIKLAIERADLRAAKREQSAINYERHLEEVEEMGGIDAWRAARQEEIDRAGGKEKWLREKKERARQRWIESQALSQAAAEAPNESQAV
ncbi:hypothetical protein CC78DRAFT_534201 [Lojkania enalia]|uniref:Large ribosomal subunit protein bL28m n=1 Tax=Lojkania enalia TaxID=147567 RepID=A0A9P4K7H0_9PLEO|nr:hypothetical protein CC78DRAFT_534201 [Didymosphaeria enalia]